MWRVFYCLLIFGTLTVESARILGIFHEKSFSHQELGTKLLFALANRGHDVTMLTTVIPKSLPNNFTVLKLDLQGLATGDGADLFEFDNLNIFKMLSLVTAIELKWTEAVLKDSNVQELLQANKTFDVVIMEQLGNHALKGFCHFYNAHCIILSTMGSTSLTDDQMGNPNNPSYMPYRFLSYPIQMNFFQRLHNLFINSVTALHFHFVALPKQDAIMQKYFPNAPPLKDLMYNISLMLVNSHYSTSAPVANVPNVVEIGGFHIGPSKDLPSDIKNYLDDAPDGIVYFSMGSILKSKLMDKRKITNILNVFAKLKQKVLWKFEDDNLVVPSNVKIAKWLSQTDVLAHPNVRVFITHGGLLSTTEAIHFGVPIVGIPIFADQGLNVALAEHVGYGVSVAYSTLDEEKFGSALNNVLTKKTYKEEALRRSRIHHDQPMKPLDRAVFWVEYCFRHNGAFHLRSSKLNLRWYQYLFLDALLVLALCVVVTFLLLRITLKKLFRKKIKNE